MTEQQKQWLSIQNEIYGVSIFNVIRFGIWHVNDQGDLLHLMGEDNYSDAAVPQYSYCLTEFSDRYAEAKKGLLDWYKGMNWWRPKYEKDFNLAFSIAWQRAEEMNHEDPEYEKDFEELSPLQHKGEYLLDSEQIVKNWVIPSLYIETITGYHYALKITNMAQFLDTFSWIGFEDQRRPFEMLADLEKKICDDWNTHHRIQAIYQIDYLGDKMVTFEFDDFTLHCDEFDERYNCIIAYYIYKGTMK